MKRDMELIRKILLAAQDGKANKSIDEYSDDELKYHKALIIDKGLAEGSVLASGRESTEIPADVFISKLTWDGHDFVDAIADDTNWQRVKDFLKDAGKQLTIDTAKVAVVQLFGFAS